MPTSHEEDVLLEIRLAASDIEAAQKRLRLLFAYGREVYRFRPIPLRVLADAAGMSPSGVRTAYDEWDVAAMRNRLVDDGGSWDWTEALFR
jgi:hypothetical protein